MEETYLLKHPGVKKKILVGGQGSLPHFPPGTKLVFHFQTLLDNFERTVIDDSRHAGQPAEIFVGKMFKMEVWETLLTSMRTGEVAEFWCDSIHTGLYPIVSKGMRLIAAGKDPLEGQRHMCGMGNLFHYHSTGFPELDQLMQTPQPLIFIMELLQVGDPMSYHRESWMMEKDEKLQTVPVLHQQGNALVKQKKFREAASRYKEAVLLLKTVQSRERPGDPDYVKLGRMMVPLQLNFCQCLLELDEFYEVIDVTTELLDKHKDCVKGYYKRAKAHAAVWNQKEAQKDFNMVAQLDISLAPLVRRELKALSDRMKEKYWEEKEQYWNILERVEDKAEEEEEECVGESQREVSGDKGGAEEESTSSKTEGKDWQQMLRLVMILQKEGNFLVKEKHFEEAREKFSEALEYVNFLQKKLDNQGEDWESLEKVRLPLTLNLSQCKLELKENQEVVELMDQLLKRHDGNLKALYQRAQAHTALCNQVAARTDFEMLETLEPKFKPLVRQELKKLGERVRSMHASQKKTYWDLKQEMWGCDESKSRTATSEQMIVSAEKITKTEEDDEKSEGEERSGKTGGEGERENEEDSDHEDYPGSCPELISTDRHDDVIRRSVDDEGEKVKGQSKDAPGQSEDTKTISDETRKDETGEMDQFCADIMAAKEKQ